eukprot:TRINITY_DN1654_c0_g2_i1.p2 TRINITY_DN1654_c0_g2~~TRINITY_DN1654_c0_g2_i1.p2  ORF type:complete len:235 (+),score=65.72 TRINITY_DN1654_c0_g2_i1:249-953(+)
MAKTCPFFSYKASKLEVNKAKSSTARVVMWRKLNIPTVYTIETSFYGHKNGEHFTVRDLCEIGKNVCQALETCSRVVQSNRLEIASDPEFKEFMALETAVESDSETDSIDFKDNDKQVEAKEEEFPILNKKALKTTPVSGKTIYQERGEAAPHRNFKFMQRLHKWDPRKLPGKILNKSIQIVPKIELVTESRKNSRSRIDEKYFSLKEAKSSISEDFHFDPSRTNYYNPPSRLK